MNEAIPGGNHRLRSYNVAHGEIRKSDLAQFPGGMRKEGQNGGGARRWSGHRRTAHEYFTRRCLVAPPACDRRDCRRANITST